MKRYYDAIISHHRVKIDLQQHPAYLAAVKWIRRSDATELYYHAEGQDVYCCADDDSPNAAMAGMRLAFYEAGWGEYKDRFGGMLWRRAKPNRQRNNDLQEVAGIFARARARMESPFWTGNNAEDFDDGNPPMPKRGYVSTQASDALEDHLKKNPQANRICIETDLPQIAGRHVDSISMRDRQSCGRILMLAGFRKTREYTTPRRWVYVR